MISITDKNKCCGCTACYNICPVKCISMEEDTDGFLYPHVNTEKCIHCNKCEQVCPFLNYHEPADSVFSAYTAQYISSDEVLYHSASGGTFTAIAEDILKSDGYVYGAIYDNSCKVVHMSTNDHREIAKFRGSKYVQSELNDIFQDVKSKLDSSFPVCFSGTPCQVAGLKYYLGKNYKNLICVDLCCKGVSSPKVFREYLKIIKKNKAKAHITGINFRRKTFGYHSSTMAVDFEDGKSYTRGGITDLMMRCFRANICLRPSCAKCIIKGRNRLSDLTIFDCWHYEELTGKKDNDKGHTSILVHSQAGQQLIENCRDVMEIDSVDPDSMILLNGDMFEDCIIPSVNREHFFEVFHEKGLQQAVRATIPITVKDRMKDFSKKYLYKLGLLDTVKNIGKKL